MAGEAAAPAPAPATIDNFDDAMASVDMGAPDEAAGDDGDDLGGGQQSLGSMFDEPAPGVDPVTGREVDGPPGVPDGDEQTEDDPLEALAEDGEEQQADPATDALSKLELDGKVPEELLERLKIEQTINGEKMEVTLAEAAANGMRMVDYSRGKRELAAERADHSQAVDALIALTDGWKSDAPDALVATRREMERMGIPLEQIARDYAREYVRLQQMTESERDAWDRAKKAENDAWEARQEAAKLKAAQERGQREQKNSGVRERVEKWRDAQFKKLGVKLSGPSKKYFADHLGALWDRQGEITESLVADAAKATSEQLAEITEAYKRELAGKPKPAGLKPRSAPSASTQRQPGRGGLKATIDNFDDFMAGRR